MIELLDVVAQQAHEAMSVSGADEAARVKALDDAMRELGSLRKAAIKQCLFGAIRHADVTIKKLLSVQSGENDSKKDRTN